MSTRYQPSTFASDITSLNYEGSIIEAECRVDDKSAIRTMLSFKSLSVKYYKSPPVCNKSKRNLTNSSAVLMNGARRKSQRAHTSASIVEV